MGVVSFGIIGCGAIGQIHAGIIRDTKNARLIAVSDLTETLRISVAKTFQCTPYSNYLDLLKRDDIDAVVICLPSGLHYEVTLDAAQAGKHVVVEKPIEIDVWKSMEMVDACQKAGVKLSTILQHRFDDSVQTLKKSVADGALGRLLLGSSRTLWYRDPTYYAGSSWRGTWKMDGGGALINQSIHYIDLLIHIMGPVERVFGKCDTLLHKNIEVEDIGLASLQFRNGALGTIVGTTLAYPGLFTDLSIFGELGSVSIKNDQLDFYQIQAGSHPEFERLLHDQVEVKTGHSKAEGIDTTSHARQYADIVDAILNNREPLVTGQDGVHVLSVIKAIYESSRTGREVSLKANDYK